MDNEQESRKILSQKTVDYMNYCLFNAANNGTGGAAIFAGTEHRGQDRYHRLPTATGGSAAIPTHYTAAVWCGYDIPEQIYLTGSSANPAARLWKAVMQPIHDGLPREGLYNGNAFHSVGVSGFRQKRPRGVQRRRRGLERVVYVNVYDGDEPEGTCDKHIQVDYCVTGGGVATDYCYMFSDAQIESRSLVKLTQAEVDEIKAADGFGTERHLHRQLLCISH